MRSRRPGSVIERFGLAWILLAFSTAVAAAAEPQKSEQLWQDGLAAVSRGQFKQAFEAIDRFSKEHPDNKDSEQIHTWLQSFQALQQERESLTRTDYEKYLGWVKEHIEKEQWPKASDDLYRAFLSCADPDAFRKDPLVVQTVEGATAHAAGLREKGEWLNAIRIYSCLSEIFVPNNEEYERAKTDCRTHILLEETYTPDGEWKAAYNDIDTDMVYASLKLIGERYVTEPDFQTITLHALERLRLLAATKKLTKTFSSMNDADLVDEFSRRIASRIAQVKKESRMTQKKAIEMFDRALSVNKETLKLPQEVIIVQFMEGALEPLDEFSSMIWPSEVAQFRKDTMGEFSGVGIQISMENKSLKVISPLEDTPAYEAGIQPGDIISRINGESTVGMSIDEAVRRITGPAGTTVTLGITRVGHDKELEVPMLRQKIKIRTAKGFSRSPDGQWNCWLDPEMKIAYIRLTGFMENTADELTELLTKLRKEGVRGLVLDLRFNPGGLLKAAVDVCDVFLPSGQRIVSTRGRESDPWEVAATKEQGFTETPMILLVNDISASASEIVSGALQDHHRAMILGERTFGKGLVQNLEQLNQLGNSYIKLTTAKYYLPKGRCIQKELGAPTWGVDPDVRVKLVPKEIRKVLELRRQQDVLKGKNQKELVVEPEKETKETTSSPASQSADGEEPDPIDEDNRPEIDPQLEAATLIMRVRLLGQQPWPTETEQATARASSR